MASADKFRAGNPAVGLLDTLSATAILLLGHGAALPVTATYRAEGSGVPDPTTLLEIPVGWGVAAFLQTGWTGSDVPAGGRQVDRDREPRHRWFRQRTQSAERERQPTPGSRLGTVYVDLGLGLAARSILAWLIFARLLVG